MVRPGVYREGTAFLNHDCADLTIERDPETEGEVLIDGTRRSCAYAISRPVKRFWKVPTTRSLSADE